jgi:hypothetical protein
MGESIPARAADGLEALARFGYGAKGVVYAVVGVLAVQAAVGSGGSTTDQHGAVRAIAEQPFGRLLLGIVAMGLLGYVVWRLVQAFLDPEGKGTDPGGVVARVVYAVSGLAYASLALSAGTAAVRGGRPRGGGGGEEAVAPLLGAPGGPLLVGAIGLTVLGVAVWQAKRAATAEFMDAYDRSRMSETEQRTARLTGQVGHAARAVTFAIVGVFLVLAAASSDAERAKGLGGALDTLAAQPFGPVLLLVVALGLVAYGLFCMTEARWRVIRR